MRKFFYAAVAIIIASLAMAGCSGTAKSGKPGGGSGGSNNGGGGGNQSSSVALTIEVQGLPSLHNAEVACGALGLKWELTPFSQDGKLYLSADTSYWDGPELVECNGKVGKNWLMTDNGVCQEIMFIANGVDITTKEGFNFSFLLYPSGNVDLVAGDPINFYDCDNPPVVFDCDQTIELEIEMLGIQGNTAELYGDGGGLNWSHGYVLYADTVTKIQVCPAEYTVNAVDNGLWIVGPGTIANGYELVVNGTTISTGQPNGYGGYNWTFSADEQGAITLVGDTLGTGSGTTPSGACEVEFTYQGTYPNPRLHLSGDGISWATEFTFTKSGDTMSVVIELDPAEFQANMDMLGNGTVWYVNDQGLLTNNFLWAENLLLDYYQPNGYGGHNLIFTVNADCSVTVQ